MKSIHFSFAKIIILSILTFLLIASCDVTDPKKDKPKPEGYQEDIPWPSLADSPWPMYRHDAQNTGRSQYEGPSQGVIYKIIPAKNTESGCTIGFDGIFYYTYEGKLVASDFNGNTKWELWLGYELFNSPLVGIDTTIYLSNSINSILAIDKNGKVKWEYKTSKTTWNATLGIDKAGNIYFVSNYELFVLSKSGKLLWSLYDSRLLSSAHATFAFSPDGNTLYLQGTTVSLLAIDLNSHSVKWTFGDRKFQETGATVDSKGNIYLFQMSDFTSNENYFYCLTPEGEIKWKFKHDDQHFDFDNLEPAIDKHGNIYFGFENLYSLDYKGNLRWKKSMKDINETASGILSAIVCDKSGNIYIGVAKGNIKTQIISFSSEGAKRWEVELDSWNLSSSASITNEGTLIVPTFRDYSLYLIK